jgi:protease-4
MPRRWILTVCFVLLTPIGFLQPTAAAQDKSGGAAQATIAVFQLEGTLTEGPADDMAAIFGNPEMSLRELLTRMRKAGDDANVKAVVLMSDGGQAGLAQLEEIRQVIKDLRDKGKDVYAHSGSLGLGEFVMFCGANRVAVVPTGDVWVTGLYAEQPFLRGLLDKIGTKPDFMTCGAYKSAAELFMRSEPSPEADEMMNWLLDGIYGSIVKQIASGRGVDESTVRQWIDNGPYTATKAKEVGLIDAVEQRQDFESMLRGKYGEQIAFNKKYGDEKKKELDLSSPMAMFKIWGELLSGGSQKKKPDKPAVGIVYVEGPIVEGKGESSLFAGRMAASSAIRKALDEAARDDSIKAVVLRVDSPGGSATASEIILDATKRVKAKKPFVVSMGNVAGSGGYYVACGADTIYADESTITGSIGVVFGKFITNPSWNKIGITFTPYKRGANAGLLSSGEEFSPEQRKKVQAWMNHIYDVFKGHVTNVRGDRLKKPIEDLAGGRVYTGKQALDLGLIDKIGSLNDAVAHVAEQANLEPGYAVRVVPEPKNFIEKILEEMGDGDPDESKWLRLAGARQHQQQLSILDLALPYLQQLDGERVRVVVRTLRQAQTLQEDGCVLMMPEVIIKGR